MLGKRPRERSVYSPAPATILAKENPKDGRLLSRVEVLYGNTR